MTENRAEVYKASDGWRFRVKSKGNNEIVAQSEGYQRKVDAVEEAGKIVDPEDVEVTDGAERA